MPPAGWAKCDWSRYRGSPQESTRWRIDALPIPKISPTDKGSAPYHRGVATGISWLRRAAASAVFAAALVAVLPLSGRPAQAVDGDGGRFDAEAGAHAALTRAFAPSSGLFDPPTRAARPELWENRAAVRPGDPQYEAALRAAGASGQRPGQPVVVLDPGHGGFDEGAHVAGRGEALSNLRFARALKADLERRGVHVVLTRENMETATLNFSELPHDDLYALRADLHARTEMAHYARADLFVSIHSNGHDNPHMKGLQAWYFPALADDGSNRRFAERMLRDVDYALANWGYDPPGEVLNAICIDELPGFCDPLYVPAPFLLIDADAARRWGRDPASLGLIEDLDAPAPPPHETITPRIPMPTVPVSVHKYAGPIDLVDPETQSGPAKVVRGTMMPTVLVELLFMTNAWEAGVLGDPGARRAMVRGMSNAIIGELRERGLIGCQRVWTPDAICP